MDPILQAMIGQLPGSEEDGFLLEDGRSHMAFWSVASLGYVPYTEPVPPVEHDGLDAFTGAFLNSGKLIVAHRFGLTADGGSLELELWTADPAAGRTSGELVHGVEPGQLEELAEFLRTEGAEDLKRRFGWPMQDNFHCEPRTGWRADQGGTADRQATDDYSSLWTYKDWRSFAADWAEADPARNTVFEYALVPQAIDGDADLSEGFDLHMWMVQSRQDADRGLIVRGCTAADVPEIRSYLASSASKLLAAYEWTASPPEVVPAAGPAMR